jgi:hypothetical protein
MTLSARDELMKIDILPCWRTGLHDDLALYPCVAIAPAAGLPTPPKVATNEDCNID